MNGPVTRALADFKNGTASESWRSLPFFRYGTAEAVVRKVDEAVAAGAQVLPDPSQIFNALALTPLTSVKVVILGQDPYPTPGDAHGLAFSYRGGRRLPASLRTILAEMATDLQVPIPTSGDLTAWAKQGVLLLNTALTVEVGGAGAHLKIGWSHLVDEAVASVSETQPAVVFMLWGGAAKRRAALIDVTRHRIIESGHPSPLNRARDFRGSRPFSQANTWLASRGVEPVNWNLA